VFFFFAFIYSIIFVFFVCLLFLLYVCDEGMYVLRGLFMCVDYIYSDFMRCRGFDGGQWTALVFD
jgi:hypothetical protein